MFSRTLLTRQEKIDLLNGYLRQNSGKRFIPTVLSQLVHLFYNNLRSLRLDGEKLRQFVYDTKPMVTECFSICEDAAYKNILFRMGIVPNGLGQCKDDSVEFYIKLKSLEDDKEVESEKQIDAIQIYYKLYCQETQCEWKGVAKLSLNQYAVWNAYMMRLSDCKRFKSLFFSCDIKILSIVYKNAMTNELSTKYMTKPTMMNITDEFEWVICDKRRLNKIYNAKYGYCIFSENFGGFNEDNWCFKYYPEGMTKDDIRGSIFIRLLRKPDKIKRIKMKYQIFMDNKLVVKETKEFSDDQHSNGHWVKRQSLMTNQSKYGLVFKIKMSILDIYDFGDKEVDVREWGKYGITRFKPF